MPHINFGNIETGTLKYPDSTPFSAFWVFFRTDNKKNAGTDANVFLRIGRSEFFMQPAAQGGNPFETGAYNVWGFPLDSTLGELRSSEIAVRHDNTGTKPGWCVKQIGLVVRLGGVNDREYRTWDNIGWLAMDELPFTTEVYLENDKRVESRPGTTCMASYCEDPFLIAEDSLWHVRNFYSVIVGASLIGNKGEWPNARCMAPFNDKLYVISGNTLYAYKGAVEQIGPDGDWGGAKCMAQHRDALYLIAGNDELWELYSDNSYKPVFGGPWWSGAKCMASFNDKLYVIARGDTLYTVSPTTLIQQIGPDGDWAGAKCMARGRYNDKLYIIAGNNQLWELSPDNSYRSIGGIWHGAQCLASCLSGLFIVASDILWRVNTDTGAPELPTKPWLYPGQVQ